MSSRPGGRLFTLLLKTTPYEALYGQPHPLHFSYVPGDSELPEVDRGMVTREFKLQLLKYHLDRSQQRMKMQSNKRRTDRQFSVGDWVYLKIQPHRQVTMVAHHFSKLSSKYYSPYMVIQKVGLVTYKLSLPVDLLLHPTFHVSVLKPCFAVPAQISHPPVLNISSPYCPKSVKILDRRMVQKGNKVVVQLLIQWEHLDEAQATWEDANALRV
ncbi:uncharacterized protein LOC107788830 [Nicotiana tabacum]